MKVFLTIILCLTLFSCYDKHDDEKVFKGKDFTVKWYQVSTISTVTDYIDIERWGFTSNIMSANPYAIYDIAITGDTVVIKTIPRVTIYDLAAKKHGCIIKLDSTITNDEYMKKYQSNSAQYYINDTVKQK
jgi:hypothetical protein